MIKMIKSDSAEFLIPLLVAVYALIAVASVRDRLLGIATTLICMFIPYLASINGPITGLMREKVPLSDFMQEAALLVAVVTVASIARSRREALEHGDAQLASQAAEQQLVVQRDAARYQARVAAELHDSVGHSLTAIIALSEGLHGASGNPDVDEAIDLVNSLARDGLADTRSAVASLQSSPAILDDVGSGTLADSRPMIASGAHGWDQLEDLLTTVRATGISTALTETGRRPSDTAMDGTRGARLHRCPGGPHQRHAACRGCHARRHRPGPHRLSHSDHRVRRRAGDGTGRLLSGLPRAVDRSRTDQPGLRDPRARRCVRRRPQHRPRSRRLGAARRRSGPHTRSGESMTFVSLSSPMPPECRAPITVMIVDDQRATRMGLSLIINRADDLKVVAEAAHGQDALDRLAERIQERRPLPDVILMDVRMPVLNGIDATARITQLYPSIRTLVLTTYDQDEFAFGALSAGASGFLLRHPHGPAPPGAAGGQLRGRHSDPTHHPRAAQPAHTQPYRLTSAAHGTTALGRLSPREREVAELVAEGLTNAEIAQQLVLAPDSVKKNVTRILTKLDLRDRVQLVILMRDAQS